ncbi:MAG TPA: hypothetical protein VHL53_08030 [Acidimicrobiia bacterium]|nr:hypothetical protein [Acidimicrobiia bacterium]
MGRYIRNQWDRVAAVVCAVAGAVFLWAGWIGVSGTLNTGKQVPYVISGGMAGIFLLGLAALFWLAADLRDEWRKLDSIERHLPHPPDRGTGPAAARQETGGAPEPAPQPEVTNRR